jgi:AcrR family transcriptional regulator
MRRLGEALGADPMAVYHHVPNKRALLSLVVARVVGQVAAPASSDPWDVRVRAWARSYWEVVVRHRELMAVALADPVVAAGGVPAIEPLTAAVADSGVEREFVEPIAWLVVDAVHGSALGTATPGRDLGGADDDQLRRAFEVGLDVVVAGIAARSRSG